MSEKKRLFKDNYIKKDQFIAIALECGCNAQAIVDYIISNGICDSYDVTSARRRIHTYRTKGLLPLESGNKAPSDMLVQKVSTYFDKDGNVRGQWVSAKADDQQYLQAFESAVKIITDSITPLTAIPPTSKMNEDLATIYISNDVHFGALMWEPETGEDYDTEIATMRLKSAYNHLFQSTPNSKIGIVCDLGDLMEVDSFLNATPKSGNPLDSDSRFPKILRAAYEGLIYAVQLALTKHEVVYFYNIVGNHDMTVGHAIREIIHAYFKDEPRVIVNDSPMPVKYHQHGETLIGFAHGDGLKMRDAGETMAHDCQDIFSSTKHRYMHFGHTHKDAVYDGKLCKSESHRNLAPLNAWAHSMGFRRGAGTMKAITYSYSQGEVSRNLFNVIN